MVKKRKPKKIKSLTYIRIKLHLWCSDYTVIKPLSDLYQKCLNRLEDLLKMRNWSVDEPMTWQEYDYWIQQYLKDMNFSEESANKLAPVFVCCWFQWNKVALFGPDLELPPIRYNHIPKIIKEGEHAIAII